LPSIPALIPFYYLNLIVNTMSNDGFISPKLYIHKNIWKTDRGVIKSIVKKNKYMLEFIEELKRLRNVFEKSSVSCAKVYK
jgi:hypothetical protein